MALDDSQNTPPPAFAYEMGATKWKNEPNEFHNDLSTKEELVVEMRQGHGRRRPKKGVRACRGTVTVLTERTGIFTAICVALKQSRTE